MKTFLGFEWAHGNYVYGFFFLIAFVGVLAVARFLFLKAAAAYGFKMRPELFKNVSIVRNSARFILAALGFLLLGTALLQPQREDEDQLISRFGRDVVIVLDISRSMLAKDMRGDSMDRLTFCKEKIQTFVKQLGADRVSLLLFAGDAFTYVPLTPDYELFLHFLNQVDTQMTSVGTTSIKKALQRSLDIYAASSERKSKIVILFTDGEDFSEDLSDVRQQVIEHNISLFALGVGSRMGAPIPLYDTEGKQIGYQKDSAGSIVISKLNEPLLKQLAQDVSGRYLVVTEDASDLHQLKSYLEQFDKENLGDEKVKKKHEFFHYIAFLALLCFIGEWCI